MRYVIILFCIYAAWFIFRTSFVVDGERYFALFDDEMISMRYAENLAHGHGLIWNRQRPDERVEGYTNLLWTLFMAGFHLLPIPKPKMSLTVQILGALFLLTNLVYVKKIAELFRKESPLPLLAVVFTAFYLPLNDWGLQGTEVSILTLLISLSVFLSIKSLDFQNVPWYLYLPLGIATLVRPDAGVPFLAFLFFMIIIDKGNRQRHICNGLITFIFFIGLQTVFRLAYYGDLFPNTYYLKMTGYPLLWRVGRGILVLKDFLFTGGLLLFTLPFIIFRAAGNRRIQLLVVLIFTQIAYSVYVGGDAWESWGGANRYISIIMPLFFILLAQLLVDMKIRWKSGLVFWVVAIISFLSLNALNGPQSLLRLVPPDPMFRHAFAKSIPKAKLLEELTTMDAKIAVFAAGTGPYFLNRETVDMLGKCDKYISHLPSHRALSDASLDVQMRYFLPGHTKYDFRYTIGLIKPDVVTRWTGIFLEVRPFLSYYVRLGGIYFRKGSPKIKWDKLHSYFAAEELYYNRQKTLP